MAVTGQCEHKGQFGVALVEYASENNNGPATVTPASGAKFRRYLARRFNGDFHRMTCRSATNCDDDAHTGFRLSLAARASDTRSGGSYLIPKSIRDAISQTVELCTASRDHLYMFLISLDKRMYMSHQILTCSYRNSVRHKFLPNLHRAQAVRMLGQDCSNRIERSGRTFHGCDGFRVEFAKPISDHPPRIDFRLNRLFAALKISDLLLSLGELLLMVHLNERIAQCAM